MLLLPKNPTIKDFQQYVEDLEVERGFKEQDILQKCLLLGEEIGELFKAVRKHQTNLRIDSNSKVGTIEEELADILIYTCAIANRHNIDLERAFREKEEINKKRTWK
jgi:NTP pyrophosphatase (non-canonical NTP hydrolase)